MKKKLSRKIMMQNDILGESKLLIIDGVDVYGDHYKT